MRPDRDATVLNGNLVPIGALTACPASAVATLGVIRPVQVWCGGLLGHDGSHEFRLTWTDPASPVVAPSATDEGGAFPEMTPAQAAEGLRLNREMVERRRADRLPTPDAVPSGEATDGTTPTKEA